MTRSGQTLTVMVIVLDVLIGIWIGLALTV
jgi:hypothetical protein